MAKGYEVLEMLCPAGGWIISGDNFDDIEWIDERPRCSKAEFEAGFNQVEAHKLNVETAKIEAVKSAQAKLTALGLTTDDLKALGL